MEYLSDQDRRLHNQAIVQGWSDVNLSHKIQEMMDWEENVPHINSDTRQEYENMFITFTINNEITLK